MSELRTTEPLPRLPWVWFGLLVAVRVAMIVAQPFLTARVPEWAWANNDGYDTIAIHWVETGTYALERDVPTAIRLPLYPALIAAAYRVGGAAYPWLVMGMQAALSIWTGWLLFRMAAGLFGRRSGLIALALFIFHPQVNHFIFRCATETLFIFLVVGLAHEAVLFLRTRAPRHLIGAAARHGAFPADPADAAAAGLAGLGGACWAGASADAAASAAAWDGRRRRRAWLA
jgi:hypothetical protein